LNIHYSSLRLRRFAIDILNSISIFIQGPHKRPKEEGPDSPEDEPQLNQRQVGMFPRSYIFSIKCYYKINKVTFRSKKV